MSLHSRAVFLYFLFEITFIHKSKQKKKNDVPIVIDGRTAKSTVNISFQPQEYLWISRIQFKVFIFNSKRLIKISEFCFREQGIFLDWLYA